MIILLYRRCRRLLQASRATRKRRHTSRRSSRRRTRARRRKSTVIRLARRTLTIFSLSSTPLLTSSLPTTCVAADYTKPLPHYIIDIGCANRGVTKGSATSLNFSLQNCQKGPECLRL